MFILYGNNIKLGGQGQVNLIGNVSYTIGGGTIPGAASVTAPLVRQEIEPIEDPDAAKIENLAWRNGLVKVGKIAHAEFLVTGFEGGETATIDIYEWDANGDKQLVDTITTTLDDGAGHYSVPWQYSAEAVAQDVKADEASNDTDPLTYRFEVEIDGEQSTEVSAPLWLYKDVQGTIKNDNGTPVRDGVEVILYTADSQKLYEYTVNGKVTFKDVVVGKAIMDVPGIEVNK